MKTVVRQDGATHDGTEVRLDGMVLPMERVTIGNGPLADVPFRNFTLEIADDCDHWLDPEEKFEEGKLVCCSLCGTPLFCESLVRKFADQVRQREHDEERAREIARGEENPTTRAYYLTDDLRQVVLWERG